MSNMRNRSAKSSLRATRKAFLAMRRERRNRLPPKEQVLHKYGRPDPEAGRPMTCKPGRDERRTGNDGKVIFDTREDAERAAWALHLLGYPLMSVYECPRSRHGHCHLTSRPQRTPGG